MDFKELLNKIKAFYEENSRNVLLIGGASIIVIILIILIILIAVNSTKKIDIIDKEIVLTETQIIPNGPEIQKDYVISRKSKEMWNDDEVSEWFTVPSLKDVENLGKANESLVNDILGNAP